MSLVLIVYPFKIQLSYSNTHTTYILFFDKHNNIPKRHLSKYA